MGRLDSEASAAYFHKCRGCNLVYAVEIRPDPQDYEVEDSLPDECQVCGGADFVLVHDENAAKEGETKVSEAMEEELRDRERYY